MAVKTFTDSTTLPASDINTYLANAGWVYLTTISPAGSATSAFVDGVFTSTYRNYVVVADWYTNNIASVTFRMRAGGADEIGGVYYDRGFQNTTGTVAAINNTVQTASFFGASTSSEYAHAQFMLFHPQVATRTSWNLHSNDAWNVQTYIDSGIVATATSYDGIKFISSSGNLYGTFRFYGVRNA